MTANPRPCRHATRRAHPKLGTIILLGSLTAIGAMSIDLYLPSLPAIGRDFHVDAATVQRSMTAFFIGMAAGGLVYGPASDRFGRRPALLAGIALYVRRLDRLRSRPDDRLADRRAFRPGARRVCRAGDRPRRGPRSLPPSGFGADLLAADARPRRRADDRPDDRSLAGDLRELARDLRRAGLRSRRSSRSPSPRA